MKKISLTILILSLAAAAKISAQYDDNDFSISINYNYTTTSKLFLNPKSEDEFTSNQSLDYDDVKSVSAEIRYRINESLTLGLSVEKYKIKHIRQDYSVTGYLMNVEDGFKIYPVQLTAYYILPFSTELFKFYMGGGVGIYFGEHIRNFSDVSVTDAGSSTELGIHIKTGLDYMVEDFLSIRGEMNFRDPEVDLTSKYNKSVFEYQNRTYLLSGNSFDTKVNIDGVSFTIGAAFHF
ncbi:MAG: OmpW family outer membrane protein [Ignavibacteria bacterium]|jgi:opacity protein-like surface antigen